MWRGARRRTGCAVLLVLATGLGTLASPAVAGNGDGAHGKHAGQDAGQGGTDANSAKDGGNAKDANSAKDGNDAKDQTPPPPPQPSASGSNPARRTTPQGRSCPGAGDVPAPGHFDAAEAALLCLINAQRAAGAVGPLTGSAQLQSAADEHSGDMVAHDYFNHVSQDGRQLADRVRATGYLDGHPNWVLGETMAWGGKSTKPDAIVDAFMKSATHRAVLLDPRFTDVGIALVSGTPRRGQSGVTLTIDYGQRSS